MIDVGNGNEDNHHQLLQRFKFLNFLNWILKDEFTNTVFIRKFYHYDAVKNLDEFRIKKNKEDDSMKKELDNSTTSHIWYIQYWMKHTHCNTHIQHQHHHHLWPKWQGFILLNSLSTTVVSMKCERKA